MTRSSNAADLSNNISPRFTRHFTHMASGSVTDDDARLALIR